ncbi:MAG: ABC transporter ATP-binding protein [Planctomycetota bacterium]|jgi:ABC-2 type transport system ATP-binding protein
MTKTASMISVHDLQKAFGDTKALDGMSLKMHKGILGLIGPNGAGKTTLIRILLGLIRPDNGDAAVLGFDVRKDSLRIRQKIGILHETPSYPGSLKVTYYLHRVSNLYEKQRSCDELLDLVGLADAKDKKIRNLSAGMKQKLGIAQALIGEPELVFLDEPTSNLDPIARSDILQMILHIHKDTGVSFLISSHILIELEKVCTDIAFMNDGKVIESGSIIDVLKKHSDNRYVILLSDPHALVGDIQGIRDVISVEISGAKSITVRTKKDMQQQLLTGIEQLAQQRGVSIYEIDKTSSLDQAFREVMRNEKIT